MVVPAWIIIETLVNYDLDNTYCFVTVSLLDEVSIIVNVLPSAYAVIFNLAVLSKVNEIDAPDSLKLISFF